MKQNIILTSLIAISMSCGAHAATTTDVTFSGNYTQSDGTTANVKDALAAATYSYTASDGSTISGTAYDADPDKTKFTYTAPDGSTANLNTDIPQQSDYVGTTAAAGDISTTQEIVAGATMDRDNYSYVNGVGETVTLGTQAQSFTETIELGNGETITVTDGTASSTNIDPTTYSFTYTSNMGQEVTLFLNETGDGFKRPDGTVATIDPSETAAVNLSNELISRYTDDTNALTNAINNTQQAANDEATLFAAANSAFEADTLTVAGLNDDFATIATAQNLLTQAQAAQQVAANNQETNNTVLMAAKNVFDAPILDTITTGANDAIDAALTDNGAIKTSIDAAVADNSSTDQAYTDTKVAALADGVVAANTTAIETNAGKIAANTAAIETNAGNIAANATAIETNAGKIAANTTAIGTNADKIAANTAAITAEVAAREAGDALTLSQAQSYADTQDILMLGQAKAYADAQNTMMLKSANEYTDQKVSSLEKELSAGIASATALSSVAVSNVSKGEVSVGGGYGYYNSQSAIALGAAMGLTDNWSVNAGAGLSDGNVAFRAGTNYKFKLF